MSAIEEGIITPTTKERLLELESDVANLDSAIAKEKVKQSDITREDVVSYLEMMRRGDVHSKQYEDMLIHVFLNRVYLYDDKIKLVLNYDGGNHKIGLKSIKKMEKEAEKSSCFKQSGVPIFTTSNGSGFSLLRIQLQQKGQQMYLASTVLFFFPPVTFPGEASGTFSPQKEDCLYTAPSSGTPFRKPKAAPRRRAPSTPRNKPPSTAGSVPAAAGWE